MKRLSVLVFLFLCTGLLYSQSFYKALEPGKNQMAVYVEGCDWGPCVNKIVIKVSEKISPESLKLSDFEVERILCYRDTGLKKSNGELVLTEVFTSDSRGNKIDAASNYITILTDVYPTTENASPFPNYVSSGIFDNIYSYCVSNDELDLKITNVEGFVN